MSNQDYYIDNQDNHVFRELASILAHGFILSLFTIDFFCFEYVLPILGSLIMLFGCHLVKNENIYFKRTYYIATARFVMMLFNFLIDWTIYHNNLVITYIQITVSAILIVLLFFNLNLAFKTVYHLAGITSYSNRLAQYIILYLCSIAATYLTVHLGVLGAMISLLILIFNILFLMLTFLQIGNVLSTVDIDITITHYTVSDKKRSVFLLGIYGVLLFFTVLFSNKAIFLPFSTSNTSSKQSSIADAENRLLNLGMKKEILDDLPASEIEYLLKANSVTERQNIRSINKGTLEITFYEIDCPDFKRVIVHYRWLTPPSNRLYQILECQYNNDTLSENITSSGFVTDIKQHTTLETPNISIGLNDASYPYVQHKLSNEGEDLRGYLAFSYHPDANKSPERFSINCYYQVSVFNLPYLNIIDYMNNYKSHTNSFVFDRLNITFTIK